MRLLLPKLRMSILPNLRTSERKRLHGDIQMRRLHPTRQSPNHSHHVKYVEKQSGDSEYLKSPRTIHMVQRHDVHRSGHQHTTIPITEHLVHHKHNFYGNVARKPAPSLPVQSEVGQMCTRRRMSMLPSRRHHDMHMQGHGHERTVPTTGQGSPSTSRTPPSRTRWKQRERKNEIFHLNNNVHQDDGQVDNFHRQDERKLLRRKHNSFWMLQVRERSNCRDHVQDK